MKSGLIGERQLALLFWWNPALLILMKSGIVVMKSGVVGVWWKRALLVVWWYMVDALNNFHEIRPLMNVNEIWHWCNRENPAFVGIDGIWYCGRGVRSSIVGFYWNPAILVEPDFCGVWWNLVCLGLNLALLVFGKIRPCVWNPVVPWMLYVWFDYFLFISSLVWCFVKCFVHIDGIGGWNPEILLMALLCIFHNLISWKIPNFNCYITM